jgi:antitoxin component YwqK of YwqJK toxin-antitoxin module
VNLNKPVQKWLKIVEFNGVWSRFAAMRISGVLLCVSALLLVGCGGNDDGSGSDISTTKISQGSASTNTTQGATNAVAPVDISTMKYSRRTNATTVITNVVLVFFKDKEHFEAKKRFTGNAIKNNKDGTQAFYPMKDGLWHGTFRIKYPGGKQTKSRVNYVQGLKSGAAHAWYANGTARSQSLYANGFRVGPWITFHPNGETNKVMVLSTKIPGKVLRRAAFDLTGRPLTGKTPVGRKIEWQVNGTVATKELSLSLYKGKPSSTLTTVFGNPDQRKGNMWLYSGLTIHDIKTGEIKHTARFTVNNGAVTAVEVLP